MLPGGFSYGDYLRCGAISARSPIMTGGRRGRRARSSGARHLQRLPDPLRGAPAAGCAHAQRIACTSAAATKPLRIENNRTAWTNAFDADQLITVPLKNGEGNYVADDATP